MSAFWCFKYQLKSCNRVVNVDGGVLSARNILSSFSAVVNVAKEFLVT